MQNVQCPINSSLISIKNPALPIGQGNCSFSS